VTPVQNAARAAPDRNLLSHHREQVMGTVVTIDVFGDVDVARNELYLRIARARALLHKADAVFSTWKEHSPINQLRRGEITVAEAPREVAAVLEACATARSLSDGWFDPWAMPGGLDPTGYVKGWAAQRALSVLSIPGITGGIVNAAGDVAASGCPGSGRPFRVAIVDPFDRRRFACVVELDGGIATSGTYERGEHLIDPRTGEPVAHTASASVTGPDLGLADALATALAVAGPAGLAFIEPIEGYEGYVIGYDGSWQSTANFPFDTRPRPGPIGPGRTNGKPGELPPREPRSAAPTHQNGVAGGCSHATL
jgi:thiamine biosynthesis lipoprotein